MRQTKTLYFKGKYKVVSNRSKSLCLNMLEIHKSTDVFILKLQVFGFSAAVRCIWYPGCHNNQQGMLWEFPLSVTLKCLIGLA